MIGITRFFSLSRLCAVVLATLLAAWGCATNTGLLDIYFVDVEGGQATLVITPAGESLLVDAGYPGKGRSHPVPGDAGLARDAQRIAAAAADANISRIDFLLVTHFHKDHFGGAIELAQLLPIGTVIDHGTESRELRSNPATLALLQAYRETREQSNYLSPTVGERLPLKGIDVTVVSSAGDTLATPLAGAGGANPACAVNAPAPSEPLENPRSTGILLRHGKFRFLDLGDLVGEPLSNLVCPEDMIGPVDAYLVPHHGSADAADPATLDAFGPRVAILNNGATKGGHPPMFDSMRASRQPMDVWQLHRSEIDGAANFPDEYIANLGTQTNHWIRIRARVDGSFRVLNGRTGRWKNYESR